MEGNRASRIGLARFRLDGLAYLVHRDPAQGPGVVTTKPFILGGARLVLNTGPGERNRDAATPAWRIQVALIDARGSVLAESVPLVNGDGLELEVRWRDPGAVASASGSQVRLRATLHRAALYSFTWLA